MRSLIWVSEKPSALPDALPETLSDPLSQSHVPLRVASSVALQNQRFEPDTGKLQKMQKSLSPQRSRGLRRCQRVKKQKNAETSDTKTRKMHLIGFDVTGFR